MKRDAVTSFNRKLDRHDLDAVRFSDGQCDALFAAILIDDEVDEDVRLPSIVRLDYSVEELAGCFRLCRQLWYSGFDRDALIDLTARLIRDHDLSEEDRLRFKHMRAKFKHFRYAHALYGEAHRYPRMLDHITVTMGHVQDACRYGCKGVVLRQAVLLRLLLSRIPLARLRREADHILLATPQSFRALLERDTAALKALVAGKTVTGHGFHATRKLVGRQVSFWDSLRTIEPLPERFDMSRSLSAINGLMGGLHDRLVERRSHDPKSYHLDFVLPREIRDRVEALLAVLQRACAGEFGTYEQ